MSFAAWDLSLDEAVEIGREFQQNAIFWIDEGRIEVASCENGERKFVGMWEERFRLWSVNAARRLEIEHAESLRNQGYAVWQK